MEIDYGHQWKEKILGNIYKGRVEDVLPGLGSAFVDVGINESLFLSQGEINTAILLSRGLKARNLEIPISKVLRPNLYCCALLTLRKETTNRGSSCYYPSETQSIATLKMYW